MRFTSGITIRTTTMRYVMEFVVLGRLASDAWGGGNEQIHIPMACCDFISRLVHVIIITTLRNMFTRKRPVSADRSRYTEQCEPEMRTKKTKTIIWLFS